MADWVHQYIGGDGLTTDWERAPAVVHNARAHIKDSLNSVFDSVPDFNELLRWLESTVSSLYPKLTDSKRRISSRPGDGGEQLRYAVIATDFVQFHSDDERGVYPFVAGLSLGSDATMTFRWKHPPSDSLRCFLAVNLRHVRTMAAITTALMLTHSAKGDILLMDGEDFQTTFQYVKSPRRTQPLTFNGQTLGDSDRFQNCSDGQSHRLREHCFYWS